MLRDRVILHLVKSFRTELTLPPAVHRLTHATPVMTVGSCFSDAVGSLFTRYKFKTLANPFGVVYNPIAIHNLIRRAVFNEPPSDSTFINHSGRVYNFDFHSSFSGKTRHELEQAITNALGTSHHFLTAAPWLILTYGTAWVYERNDTGEVVANCHKVEASAFRKKLLSVDDITKSFGDLLAVLKPLARDIKILLTVSPVRHLRDTFELNSVSKAVLRLACHQLSTQYADVDYFPAFEIMFDDLRDYRFYEPDMLHPTEEAIAYTWEKFIHRYADDGTLAFIAKWDPIDRALAHRAFHPDAEPHREFLGGILKKLEALGSGVDVSAEVNRIQAQLSSPTKEE
jgi:hypothetical protein